MKRIFFICLTAACCSQAFPQAYMNNWYFGNNAALDFTSGTPIFHYSPMRSFEASATISDSLGNLLFFTSGERIWDRNGVVMPNGDSLEIGKQGGVPFIDGSSVTQGVIILPIPGYNWRYYLFYLANGLSGDPYGGLRLMYSIVDMNLNSGNGDILADQKNITVDSGDYMWEKMTAEKHANGEDFWLIGLSGRMAETDSFYFEKFLISEDGISVPEFQFYDLWSSSYDALFTSLGQMKFSPSGTKLANTRGSDIDIFNFDRCSGLFSQRITIDTVHNQTYGLEFSPNNNNLYISTLGQSPNKAGLFQLCLDCVPITKTMLYKLPNGNDFGQLLLASDGKIYTSSLEVGVIVDNSRRYLSVINYPDSFGLACDFDTATLQLGDSAFVMYGLPNFVNYDLSALAIPCDTTTDIAEQIINKEEIIIYPNPANNVVTLKYLNGSPITDIYSIEICDAFGKVVKTLFSNANTIDISSIPNGIYLLKVKLAQGEQFNIKLEILK